MAVTDRLQRFVPKKISPAMAIALGLSLVVTLLWRLPELQSAFASEYLVQDDARQHVFWMQRFADPELFRGDLLADYFESVAPWGYTNLYRLGIVVGGWDVWTLNKLLPLPIALVAVAYGFGTAVQLVPSPLSGLAAALFLNWSFLMRDDIVSATPAAFVYPFFLAFTFYLLKKQWLPCALSIVGLGLFYPQLVLVAAGVLGLRLLRWQRGRWRLGGDRADRWLWASGWLAAFCVLLPHALHDSPFGPVLSVDRARELFALSADGWSKFFVEDATSYWLCGKRSGLFPREWCGWRSRPAPILQASYVAIGSLGTFMLVKLARTGRIGRSPRLAFFLQVTLASVVCFLLAHLLLFRLHLPNRYTEHSLRVLLALAGGIGVGRLQQQWAHSARLQVLLWGGLGMLAALPLAVYFAFVVPSYALGEYVRGEYPALYRYFQAQPKDIRIASLAAEANQLPTFAGRTILVGSKSYALPYHSGFYEEVRKRTVATIEAQYGLDPARVLDFLERYSVDRWLIDRDAFSADWIGQSDWLLQFARETDAPQLALAADRPTALQVAAPACIAFTERNLLVLEGACLRRELQAAAVGSLPAASPQPDERIAKPAGESDTGEQF